MNILVNLIGVWYILSKAITSVLVLTWNFLGNKFWTFKNVHRVVHIPTHYNLKFSIVIPAYNEAQRIESTLVAINAFLKKTGVSAEIIVVNDGSTDTTVDTVRQYQKSIPNLSLVDYGSNEGKGFAIKSGIIQSRGEYILFTDADNSTPIEELVALHHELENGEFDVAIGSRFLPQSNIVIKQSTYRVALGRIGNLLIRAFLLSNIRDTQCGFKLFTHEAAQHIFDLQKVRRFGFDMEALVIGKNLGYKIKEVPVSWLNSTDSRVRPIRDAVRTLIELMYIKFNLLSGRYDTEKN